MLLCGGSSVIDEGIGISGDACDTANDVPFLKNQRFEKCRRGTGLDVRVEKEYLLTTTPIPAFFRL